MSPQNQAPGQTNASRRPPDIEDYIDMMRRYRAWIIGPMFAGLVIATVVAFMWPDTYVSTAVMRIVPQQVPASLMPALNDTRLVDKLMMLQTEILSKDSLAEIIQKPTIDIYKKQRLKQPMEDTVLEMKNKYIRISPMVDRQGGARANSFQISFANTERYKAQLVVRELVNKFSERNGDLRRKQTSATTTFLSDELKQAKDKMDRLDQQLTKFRTENVGRLPEHVQANASAQSNLQMQMMNLATARDQTQQDKLLLETNLKNLQNRQRNATANLEQTVAVNQPSMIVRNEGLINLDNKISAERSKLASMLQLYGNNHPDVTAQRAVVDSYEMQRLAADKPEAARPQAPTQTFRTEVNKEAERNLEDLKGEIAMVQTQINAKQSRMDEIAKQQDQLSRSLATYQRRLEEEPVSSQQYAALQTDFALAKADYEDKMKKRDTAESAHSLEQHGAGEQLEVLEAPSLPEIATEPNRPVWAAIGVFGGLALGLVLAAAKEVKDASLKNLKDVRAYTNLPILTSVPLLENALLVRRQRRLVWLAWSASLVVGLLLMSGSLYYHLSTSI